MFRLFLLYAMCACTASHGSHSDMPVPGHAELGWPIPLPSWVNKNQQYSQIDSLYTLRRDYLKRYESLQLGEQYTMLHLLNIKSKVPLTNKVRHYSIIIGMIFQISKRLSMCSSEKSYDELYMETLDSGMPEVWQDPVSVVNEAIAHIQSASLLTSTARKMIHTTCEAKELSHEQCDEVLEKTIRLLPSEYRSNMVSLMTFADINEEFAHHSLSIEEAARELRSVEFLINSRSQLENFLNRLSDGLRILPHATVQYC